ncbi:MAG: hypothetical protein OEZ39_17700 [Gammaproteobacteria bacterium]|nr:hypothetical protein [Gammaproteobacteria bacterium]MDH5653700.1 hypothetical protein [Gammaproteobacteria bacterium]
MKRSVVIYKFLSKETEASGGFSVPHGWDISIIETLLPPGVAFPKIFKEIYNENAFDEFDSSPITFLENYDGNASEIYKYYENNIDFIKECCNLGYLPFARSDTGSFDPVCFDLSSNKPGQGDYAIVLLDHEDIFIGKKNVVKQHISKSLYQFMRNKIEN